MNEVNMVERLVIRFRVWLHRRKYTYGRINRVEDNNIRENVRLNNRTRRVEFVFWKAGEQGHVKDYWHEMGYGWELHFEPYNAM